MELPCGATVLRAAPSAELAELVAPSDRSRRWADAGHLSELPCGAISLAARTGATGYTLHVSTSTLQQTIPIPSIGKPSARVQQSKLSAFTQDYPKLYWQVTASNDRGTSSFRRATFRHRPCRAFLSCSGSPVCYARKHVPRRLERRRFARRHTNRSTCSTWIRDARPGPTGSARCHPARRTSSSSDSRAIPIPSVAGRLITPTIRVSTQPTPTHRSGLTRHHVLRHPGGTGRTVRNATLRIINQDDDALPAHYPIRIHFDNSTTPTAQEIYNASLAAAKGNDVRIVYNNATELNRTVQRFTASQIDIWFPLQTAIGGGGENNGSYQMYYGNASAGSSAGRRRMRSSCPLPTRIRLGLWHFQDGRRKHGSRRIWAKPPRKLRQCGLG